MIDLHFTVTGVEIARNSVSPLLLFRLRIRNATPATPIEHVMLQAQVRIEAPRRNYGPRERERLVELFGTAEDWNRSLHSLLWANTSAPVPGFAEECTIDLPVPCSYDFNIAATRYFHGVEDGQVPLLLLFSGTIFFRNSEGDLQIDQIARDKEAGYRLPVRIWQSMMDQYYPDSVWLRVDRDLFEQVYRYKRQRGFATLDQALQHLLETQPAEAPP